MIHINSDNTKELLIFRRGIIEDTNLLKYKNEDTNSGKKLVPITSDSFVTNGQFIVSSPSNSISFASIETKDNFFTKLITKLKLKFTKKPVEKIFKLILQNNESLIEFNKRQNDYMVLIDNAKRLGQTALHEQLSAALPVKILEDILFSNNKKQYISEQKLIQFAEQCERGLKLDYIKNFIRQIPSHVVAQKLQADELRVFDNYVILHYDPENKSTKMTNAEIEKSKDPILFGVIKGSRNLYFVADWKDEICQLTFQDLINKFGEKELALK